MMSALESEPERIALARDEILRAAVLEEKPRELCKIARLYSQVGMPGKAEETLRIALKVLEEVKTENSWKFTNYLCHVAYGMVCLEKDRRNVTALLEKAIASLSDVDAYYMKRKNEVLSLLKRISDDKRLLPHLRFRVGREVHTDVCSGIPFEQTFDFLYSYIFLSPAEMKMLDSLAERDAGGVEISGAVAGIEERWRQAVALAILARLFLAKGRGCRALEALSLAAGQARDIEFYWVRDNAYEVLSGTFLEAYRRSKDTALLDSAKVMISRIRDSWKQARAHCRIAETLIREERFKEAAQELNYVHSRLLDRIDYSDRTAMSMLLIAEVFERIDEKRRANKLREDAFSILDAIEPHKKKESLEEYERFISLREK